MPNLWRIAASLVPAMSVMLASSTQAQWQVCDHCVPIGRGSGQVFGAAAPGAPGQVFTSTGTSTDPTFQTPVTVRVATVGGTASAITLTTGLGLTSLTDGQEFIFTPIGTVVAALPTVAVDAVAATQIKGVDGYSYSVWYNIQQGKPLRIRYVASLNVFTILSPPMQFEETPFGHGRIKLQATSASSLAISQEDGRGLLMWNSATSAFRMVDIQPIVVSNIFAGNSTFVNGAANQNLAANKLYSVYVNNLSPTNQYDNRLEFWETYSGVGVAAWNPTINEIGIYVKPATAGGGSADNTRTYVGTCWTGPSDISNAIAPAASMASRCYAHFPMSRWKFGYQTTVVGNTALSSTLTTQTTPVIGSITEGISDSPRFDAKANAVCTTAGATASFRISISGTAFNGTPFITTSPTASATVPVANGTVFLTASWESAPPIGFYEARTDIAVSAGTCTFVTNILGHLSQ